MLPQKEATMRPQDFRELIYEINDGVAWVRLNRPHARNAFSSNLYGELKWAVRNAHHDPAVDVIVLTGVGKAFATGGDLKETLEKVSSENPVMEMYAFTDNLPWDALRLCTKPIIAAINGFCYAGGLITAAWCDVQIAVESARFSLSEGRIGIVDQMAPTVLFGRVPTPKLKYLYLTGKPFTAVEAEKWGFVTEVVPDDELETRVNEVVAEIRMTTPVAHKMLRRYLNELVPRAWDHGGTEAFESPQIIEGLKAFAEKRPPDYKAISTATNHSPAAG
jgi:enoyl-CoA hydratase/carnithine racemase